MVRLKLNRFWIYLSKHKNEAIFCIIVLVATVLRLYKLGEIPVGLNQDEASVTIEAKSLLETGADRWGNVLPAYFPSWGSGQNVLLSYLTIPFVYAFGVSIWSTRIVSAILGILSVLIVYLFVKDILDKSTAIICSGLMAILPWSMVTSRWGLESNILPFFLLLGFYLTSLHLSDNSNVKKSLHRKILNSLSLVPFGLAFYAYGASLTILPTIFILILVIYHKHIWQNWKSWLVSFSLFSIISAPFILFVIKNYITKVNYTWEKFLPITVPLLKVTRLEEIGQIDLFEYNYKFIITGLKDDLANTIPGFDTIPSFLFIFGAFGLVYLTIKTFSSKSSLIANKNIPSFLLVPIWLFSSIGVLATLPANVNRANTLFIPIIILIGTGIYGIQSNLNKFREVFNYVIITYIFSYCLIFIPFYFYAYPKIFSFPKDLEKPYSLVKNSKNPTLITRDLQIPYIYFLFYTDFNLKQFQLENHGDDYFVQTDYKKIKAGNFYFDSDILFSNKISSFEFMLSNSKTECVSDSSKIAIETISYQNTDWKVGRCDIQYIN